MSDQKEIYQLLVSCHSNRKIAVKRIETLLNSIGHGIRKYLSILIWFAFPDQQLVRKERQNQSEKARLGKVSLAIER